VRCATLGFVVQHLRCKVAYSHLGPRAILPGKLYHYIDDLRPQWSLKVNGQAVGASVVKGFATITRTWKPGDTVELDIPMPVR